jgi:16S rRNA (adenine1518-N6/adenine1519-N6)-dimethyltransferase
VSFVGQDVLAGKHALAPAFAAALAVRPAPPGRLLLVSNLPYSAATPIVLGILAREDGPERLVVMVQEEVGEKMLARAGAANYGVPSIHVGLKARGRILRRFGPQVFWPRPKVRSVVLSLEPIRPSALAPDEQQPFAVFVTTLFTRRRKVLPTALRTAVTGLDAEAARAALEAAGIDVRARVEAVEPAALLALWRSLAHPPRADR